MDFLILDCNEIIMHGKVRQVVHYEDKVKYNENHAKFMVLKFTYKKFLYPIQMFIQVKALKNHLLLY